MSTLADLQAAGFDVELVGALAGGSGVYTIAKPGVLPSVRGPPVDARDQATVDALLSPGPVPVEAATDVNADAIRQAAANALANLEAASANWAALSAAQKDAAALLCVRVCARLVRLTLARLDTPGV